jgi:hypothetical protein
MAKSKKAKDDKTMDISAGPQQSPASKTAGSPTKKKSKKES